MHIGFIHPSYPGDDGTGAVYSSTQIIEGLQEAGHDITVFCTVSPEDDSKKKFDLVDIEPNSYLPHQRLAINKKLRSEAAQFKKFDVIHSYPTRTLEAIADIKRKTGTPAVVTLNAYGAICPKNNLLYKGNEKCRSRNISRCLSCIAQSNASYSPAVGVKKSLFEFGNIKLAHSSLKKKSSIDRYQALTSQVKKKYSNFGFDSERIETIPNILDEGFDMEDVESKKPSFLFVGYLHHHKGADLLIPTLERYIKQYGSADLTILGTGPLQSQIEKQASNTDIADHIEIRGRIPNNELPNVFASHDIFLYPGRWDEPFGRVFLEALASETPVVSTNVGSIEEIIGDGGKIVNESPDSLADGLAAVMNAREKYVQSTNNEIADYRSENIIPRFEKLYQNAIDSPLSKNN